jgi:hypothetical protein
MKTYTLEELKAAQAKGCRIEYHDGEVWQEVPPYITFESISKFKEPLRIHPADEWKARLPRLKEGARWHRDDFTNEMLEGGYRPLALRERWEIGDEILRTEQGAPLWVAATKDDWVGTLTFRSHAPCRTRRPVPPEFLHPDELAKQSESVQATDFGEPWQPSCEMIFDRDGDYVAEFQPPFHDSSKVAARAIACVNALAGVPDPAEFVRQAKENAEILKRLGHH